jgi:hypothetical protein
MKEFYQRDPDSKRGSSFSAGKAFESRMANVGQLTPLPQQPNMSLRFRLIPPPGGQFALDSLLELTFVLNVCLAGIVCLFPLAAYLFWLLVIVRRYRPTIFTGSWDFVSLLFGLTGFLLVLGALLLMLVESNFRYVSRFLIHGKFEAAHDIWVRERWTWIAVVFLYLLVLIGVAWRTFSARAKDIVVYNVDPVSFEMTLEEIFEELGRKVERRGNIWYGSGPLLKLESFASGKTVTLSWISDDIALFQEVDRHLRAAVVCLHTEENPSVRWFRTAFVACISMMTGLSILLVYGLYLHR